MDEETPAAAPGPSDALTPRQRRARRRRHRRQLGTALFVIVAIAVFAMAYFAVADDDSADETTGTTVPANTSTTLAQPIGPYKVTAGVNLRQGPGTSFPQVATIETGNNVFVSCVTNGEVVNGPAGPIDQWLKTTGFGPQGYVTLLYVNVGDDLRTNKIPACPS